MNKYFSLIIVFIFMTLLGCKTSPDESNNSDKISKEVKSKEELYQMFYKIGDDQSSIYTLHQILQLDTTKTQYYDSLVNHYVKVGNTQAVESMVNKSLKYGKNIKVLEVSAVLDGQKGEMESATKKLNELFKLTNDYKYKYRMATFNIEAGDWKMGEDILNELSQTEGIENYSIEEVLSETESQQIPLNAAIAFARANIEAVKKNNLQGALKYVNEALKIKPDYQYAKYFKQQLVGGGRR